MCDHAPNREAAMLRIAGTPIEGVTTKVGYCDPCLLPLIQALNDGGQYTIASCCGHNRRPGWVAFVDGRELLVIPDFETARLVNDVIPFPGINDDPAPQKTRPSWREIRQALLPFGCCRHCRCGRIFRLGHPDPCTTCAAESEEG